MSRNVRCGLIQASNAVGSNRPLPEIKKAMIDKHLKLIEQAAKKKVKILCLQELFYGPYFCAEQNIRWYDLTERVPDGPTTQLMQKIAAKHGMVIVVPVYEEQMPGLYFNTAAVIDADGKYLGKYRKHHIPHVHPGFWEKFYFTPGDMGYPVFETKYARVGVYICYDRHFPEGARAVGDGIVCPVVAGFRLARRDQAVDAGLDVIRPDAGQAIGEGQHHRDEQRAEAEQPELRERFRQARLGEVHQQRAPNGAKDRHPSAHRGVDHHFDRWHDADERRRHETDFEREHRAADRGEHRGGAEREDLEVGDAVAGETDAVFLLAHRHQDAAELGQADRLRCDDAAEQQHHFDEIQDEFGVVGADIPAVQRAQIGDPV